jgi:caffeoyl-CoA O-methyltransferase
VSTTPAQAAPPRPVTPVGILAETLARLSREIDVAATPDPALAAELRRASDLAGGLDPYLAACTTPESSALAELARRTEAEDWVGRRQENGPALEQEMLSGHVEGQTLKFLVHLARARRVLEVGMFTGYSALAMAEALPDGGEVVACEVDASVADFARDCFAASPHGHKITVRVGPASDTLAELAAAGETFDLVFVDADKGGYAAYVDAVLDSGLLAPHGAIVVDNTLMQGEPYVGGERSANGEAIASFNRTVADDPRVEQVLLPLRDGLTLIRRV